MVCPFFTRKPAMGIANDCGGWQEGSSLGAPMSSRGSHSTPYPRFSDNEMRSRRDALEGVLRANDCAHALVYGVNRSGTAVGWLTRWPVTREACAVFTPGERDLLLVNFYNHVPNARRMATEADVSWALAAMPREERR